MFLMSGGMAFSVRPLEAVFEMITDVEQPERLSSALVAQARFALLK